MAVAAAKSPHVPSSTSSALVPQETIQRAASALLKWRETKSKSEKPQLLDSDEFIYLVLTLKRIPPNPRINPFKLPLPHPLFGPGSEICLIIDDRSKAKLTKEAVVSKVKADGVPVSKVLKLSKLRSNYKPFEAKRKLCDSYELFLVDTRVVHALPGLLGKHFYKQKKIPIGVDLRHLGWKEQVERVSSSGLLFLGTGTCSVVRVARLSMSPEEITENVAAAIKGVAETAPRGCSNVRSLHLKLMDSVALPIYQTVPDVKLKIETLGDENEPEPQPKKGKKKEGGQEERKTLKKKKKGSMREVRYMDMELGEDQGDGDSEEEVTIDQDEDEEQEPQPKKGQKKEGGQEERKTVKKKKKGSMREVRYMDMELDEEHGDGDSEEEVANDQEENEDEEQGDGDSEAEDTNDQEEDEDEELNVEMKKRKHEIEIGSENGVQKKNKKKKLNRIKLHVDDEDDVELGGDKPSKKLSKSKEQGKVKKEEGHDRTKIDSSGGLSKGKKETRKKSGKIAKVKPRKV